MPSKKAIIGNVLLKELIAIRTDTLWRIFDYLQKGELPEINEEGATGKLDNKGAIFIPGGLIYQDVDENQIAYKPLGALNETRFRNYRLDLVSARKDVNIDPDRIAKRARKRYQIK